MDIIKTIIEWVKRVFVWSFVVILLFVFSTLIGSILRNWRLGLLIFVGGIPLIVACRRVYKGWGTKCPNCNKLYAIVKEKTDILTQQEVYVPVETKRRNMDGDITSTHEQYVPGKRTTYQDTYKCRYCGNSYTRKRTVNRANI